MTQSSLHLDQGETLIDDEGELCYRQITPALYIDGGKVATHAFGPSTADQGKPSYSRSSLVSPQEARDWHSQNASKPSEAVYAVSVQEVVISGTFAIDDSATPLPQGQVRAPGHCFVDFRELSKARIRELRAIIYRYAMARGELPTRPLEHEDGLFSLEDFSTSE